MNYANYHKSSFHKNLSNIGLNKKDSLSTLSSNCYVPENLSWELNLNDNKFYFIGKTETFGLFAHLINISFDSFMELSKECFRSLQINVVDFIVSQDFMKYTKEKCNIHFEVLVPLLLSEKFFYVKQTIYPIICSDRVVSIRFVNIPIKEYDNEKYMVSVFNNGALCLPLTKQVVDSLSYPKLFTNQQIRHISLIRKKMNSREIAIHEKKTNAAVYKLNRKVLEIISFHFDIEFSTVAQAVDYFFQCYPDKNV
ncbi:hypothetical protein [Flavobacterium sp. C4GT6]|uniref:hypothetical protein n=1 Tax=Flavobacterium sp. C4GT6 TaxID=3103818 RepID=UPI002ED19783